VYDTNGEEMGMTSVLMEGGSCVGIG